MTTTVYMGLQVHAYQLLHAVHSKILVQFSHVILHDHHNKNLHVFGTKILPYLGNISCRNLT